MSCCVSRFQQMLKRCRTALYYQQLLDVNVGHLVVWYKGGTAAAVPSLLTSVLLCGTARSTLIPSQNHLFRRDDRGRSIGGHLVRFTSSMRFCEAVSLSSPVANICFFGFLLQVKSTGTDPLCTQSTGSFPRLKKGRRNWLPDGQRNAGYLLRDCQQVHCYLACTGGRR